MGWAKAERGTPAKCICGGGHAPIKRFQHLNAGRSHFHRAVSSSVMCQYRKLSGLHLSLRFFGIYPHFDKTLLTPAPPSASWDVPLKGIAVTGHDRYLKQIDLIALRAFRDSWEPGPPPCTLAAVKTTTRWLDFVRTSLRLYVRIPVHRAEMHRSRPVDFVA